MVDPSDLSTSSHQTISAQAESRPIALTGLCLAVSIFGLSLLTLFGFALLESLTDWKLPGAIWVSTIVSATLVVCTFLLVLLAIIRTMQR